MSITLKPKQASQETRTIKVTFDEQTGEVEYRLKGYNAQVEDRHHELVEQKRGARMLAEFIEQRVVRWEVLDANGEPYPLVYDALRVFDTDFLSAIVTAITEDMNPNKDGGSSSDNG